MEDKKKKAAPRPQKRNAEKTRNQILVGATHFFARSGYRGTSLNQILTKAKVNKRMVYHYFGSKEALYRVVHVHQWKLLAEWFAKAMALNDPKQPLTSEKLLFKAVEVFHEFSAANQDFVRLLMWDGLEGGDVSRSIWEEIRGPLYYQMEAIVLQAQKDGIVSKDLKVDHLIVSFMGVIFFYFAYANSLEDIFGKNPLSHATVNERKKQTMALFEKIFT